MRICLAVYMFLEICVRVELQLRVWERMGQECFLGEGVRFAKLMMSMESIQPSMVRKRILLWATIRCD